MHVTEEEKETGIFSPQLDGDSGTGPPFDEDFSHQAYSTHYSARIEGDCGNVEQSECISPIPNNYTSIGEQICGEMLAAMGKNMPENKLDGNDKRFSIADLLCIACNQLLVRPVALNCGHGTRDFILKIHPTLMLWHLSLAWEEYFSVMFI